MRKWLFGFLWLIFIVIITRMLIGALIGAFAGAQTSGFNAGYNAGFAASTAFFSRYGWAVTLISILFGVFGTVKGIFPGTKSKNQYKTGSNKDIETDAE